MKQQLSLYPQRYSSDSRSHEIKSANQSLQLQTLFDLHEIYYLLSTSAEVSIQDTQLLSQIHTIPRERLDELPSVLLRVQALQQQLSPAGPILLTPLFRFTPQDNQCSLCGKQLRQGEQLRCIYCAIAARLVLGYQTLCAWLLPE